MRGCTILLLSFLAMPCVAQEIAARALFAESGRPRKLIEFGWDEPDTAFMRAHIAAMQATPFDGCVFHVIYAKPGGGAGNFTWVCWGKRAFSEAELAAARSSNSRISTPWRSAHTFASSASISVAVLTPTYSSAVVNRVVVIISPRPVTSSSFARARSLLGAFARARSRKNDVSRQAISAALRSALVGHECGARSPEPRRRKAVSRSHVRRTHRRRRAASRRV